jgi:PhnB protein
MSHVQISTHLISDGECREAFVAYQRILGGTLATLMTFGESPLAASVDPKWHARIVHATLVLDGAELNGADVLPHDYKTPQGFSVILNLQGLERARRVFVALAEGGKVNMPFQSTFWSPGYGVVVDRFGTPWEINCAASGTGSQR